MRRKIRRSGRSTSGASSDRRACKRQMIRLWPHSSDSNLETHHNRELAQSKMTPSGRALGYRKRPDSISPTRGTPRYTWWTDFFLGSWVRENKGVDLPIHMVDKLAQRATAQHRGFRQKSDGPVRFRRRISRSPRVSPKEHRKISIPAPMDLHYLDRRINGTSTPTPIRNRGISWKISPPHISSEIAAPCCRGLPLPAT